MSSLQNQQHARIPSVPEVVTGCVVCVVLVAAAIWFLFGWEHFWLSSIASLGLGTALGLYGVSETYQVPAARHTATAVLALTIFLIFKLWPNVSTESQAGAAAGGQSGSEVAEAEPDLFQKKVAAWVRAQILVERMLKSPGTASYGWQTASECVEHLGDDKFRVRGWVDAQNSFGATVRSDFTVLLRRVGDDFEVIEGPFVRPR
ncbi:MAG: hypothetical protein GXP27_06305 [Planctomycetes bacterium]|nr:hypothetical protein [Planctomycetota bacterium]